MTSVSTRTFGSALRLIVILSAVAVALYICALAFAEHLIAQRLVRERSDAIQRTFTSWLGDLNRTLADGEANISRFAALISALPATAPATTLERFATDIEHREDGTWRHRPGRFNPDIQAGVWIGATTPLDDAAKMWHQQVLDVTTPFGIGARDTFFGNTWMLTEPGAEVVFDPSTPSFIYDLPTTLPTDYIAWLDIVRPTSSSAASAAESLRPVWMPVSYDSVMKTRMTSVVAPIYRGGLWIGSVGHDLLLNELLRGLNAAVPDGAYDLLVVDGSGQIVSSHRYEEQIKSASVALRPRDINDQRLLSAMAIPPGASLAMAHSSAGDLIIASHVRGPGLTAYAILDPQLIAEVVRQPFVNLRWGLGMGLGLLLGLGICVVVWDTRRRNRYEQQLAHERETAQHAQARAEHSDAVKQRFLANMSHELRTPLTGIIGMSECLGDSDLNPEQRELLAPLRQSAQALHSLLDDLAGFHAIDQGLTLPVANDFDCDELLLELLHVHQVTAHAKQVSLTTRCDPDLALHRRGDMRALRRALAHVIGNAIKFTARGGVRIDVSGDAKQLCFTVHDTGIGMSAELISTLHHPFTQGDSSASRAYGGTGIGLPLSQRLITLLGGTLTFASAPGEGTTVTVIVPIPAV